MALSEVFNMDWRLIEGRYLISSNGELKSLNTGKILKPQKTSTGYLMIQLSINGKRVNYKFHRLIAKAFIPNPDNKPEVNHIDGNPLNNSIENLEWATRSENVKHAYNTGLNSNIRPVECLDRNGVLIKQYASARDAEKDGYRNQLIAKCCSGKRKYHGGRVWQYA